MNYQNSCNLDESSFPVFGYQDSESNFVFELYGCVQKSTEVDPQSISWICDGTMFSVHDRDLFMRKTAPLYFSRQTQFKSFQRQLNHYGFERIPKGPLKGTSLSTKKRKPVWPPSVQILKPALLLHIVTFRTGTKGSFFHMYVVD